jgi:hypothetical protein
MTAVVGVSRWGAEVVSMLTDGCARSVEQLAGRTGARRGELLTFLEKHPHLLETGTGWVNVLRLTDGLAFTHELSAVEREAEVLSADDDLALWAVLAQAGLPLAGGGEVWALPLPELPAAVPTTLPAGGGLIGQALVGPPGWLAGFQAGDLLEVRLRDGVLAVRAGAPPASSTTRIAALLAASTTALGQAMERYVRGVAEAPAADLSTVLAELVLTRSDVLADPLPPLRSLLHAVGWETFGGHVGFAGTPWNLTRIRHLSRTDALAASMALGALLTWDVAQSDGEKTIETLTRALAVPEIVGYLAEEVERRTATSGTSFKGALDRVAAVAGTPAERAGAALLAARAAEGAGDSRTAQSLVDRALADQPELQPALMDAAEYAACRGDLKVADDYLRRVRHPIAATLRSAVRAVLNVTVKGTQPGRNRPCPCGSGRKFKVCCYPPVVAPLAKRAELLYNLVATFAQRAPSEDRLGHLINAIGPNPQHALLCVDLLLTHEGFTERFLRARGAWLRDDERTLIETWATTPLGAFEIRSVRRGMGVTVRMLPGGPSVDLPDRKFSTCVHHLDLLCGRLLSNGTDPHLLAIPAFVSRDRRRDLLDLLASNPSARQIAEFLGPQPDPCLQNSDGHDYLAAELTLDLPDAESPWQRLSAGLAPTCDDTLERLAERDGKTVSLGQVTREGRRWTLTANSQERLAALETLVRAEAPAAQEVSRHTERIGGEPPRDGRTVRTLIVDNYLAPADPRMDHQQAGQEFLQRATESWVDTPMSLGMTPREAALAGGEARTELEAILDDLQWSNDRNRERGRPSTMNVPWIREELGIPA